MRSLVVGVSGGVADGNGVGGPHELHGHKRSQGLSNFVGISKEAPSGILEGIRTRNDFSGGLHGQKKTKKEAKKRNGEDEWKNWVEILTEPHHSAACATGQLAPQTLITPLCTMIAALAIVGRDVCIRLLLMLTDAMDHLTML